jgi:hypothetical protein
MAGPTVTRVSGFSTDAVRTLSSESLCPLLLISQFGKPEMHSKGQ